MSKKTKSSAAVKKRVFHAKKKNSGQWTIKAPSTGPLSKGVAKKRASKKVLSTLTAPDFENQVTFKGKNDIMLITDHHNVLKKVLKNGLDEALAILETSLNAEAKNIEAMINLKLDAETYLALQDASKRGLIDGNFEQYLNQILRNFLFKEPMGIPKVKLS
jgi:hypothetical protein